MELWSAEQLSVPPREPAVLRSDRGAARAVALVLPLGEELQEHQTHEHTYVVVMSGEVEVAPDGDGSGRRAAAGAVAHFAPGERRRIVAREEARLLLLLAPWPGDGHPGARDE